MNELLKRLDGPDLVFVGLFLVVIPTLILTLGYNWRVGARLDADRIKTTHVATLQAKSEALKAGADPLAVSCAFDGAGQLCTVLVARR